MSEPSCGGCGPSPWSACWARSNAVAFLWLESFVRTFLERDLPQPGVRVPAPAMRHFWTMLGHWQVVRQLQPWHANIAKRQVKAPKVYLRDTGLLHKDLGL